MRPKPPPPALPWTEGTSAVAPAPTPRAPNSGSCIMASELAGRAHGPTYGREHAGEPGKASGLPGPATS
eukprot:7211018-Lingulodinium_polyedra.AAC.1